MPFLKEKIELAAEEAELKAESYIGYLPNFLKWSLILLILGLLPVYLITKTISVRYWNSAYKDHLVSATPSFKDPKPLSVGNITLTTSGQGIYSATVEISNENFELSLQNVPYEFRFYNQKNEFITSVSDTFFILPNQKKYLTVPRLEAQEQLVGAEIVLPSEPAWQKRLSIPKIDLLTSIPDFYNQVDPLGFTVEGSVTNNSPYQIKQIKLTFLVYDKKGDIVAINVRNEYSLRPYERRAYKQLWPSVFGSDIKSVKVMTETNALDSANLTPPEIKQDSSSDLNRPQTNPYGF